MLPRFRQIVDLIRILLQIVQNCVSSGRRIIGDISILSLTLPGAINELPTVSPDIRFLIFQIFTEDVVIGNPLTFNVILSCAIGVHE